MCGIIGTTNSKVSEKLFEEALVLMGRRGPDFKGVCVEENVSFGHVRLAILDLDERSNQPFKYTHENKYVLLTFNGEIYNYLELRNELSEKGYQFNTNSDTEVVAASFLEWGVLCFNKFVGMWALGIKYNEKLILSRDRVGKKPLFYGISKENNISFSSSLKALSKLEGYSEISKEGVELYFALGFIPKKYSILTNVFKLEPGEIKVFSKKENGYCLNESFISELILPSNSDKTKFKALFIESVKRRVLSDVPIATLMSGGVDSTIVSVVTRSIVKDVESFFVDFEDKKFSEKKWADYLAQKNSIKLSHVLLSDDELTDGFNNYYDAYEEPFADYSGIPSIAIFKKVAKKYKVVLTGDGGDELFFGYPHYFKKAILYKMFGIAKLFATTKFMPNSIKEILNGNKQSFESNYLKNHGIVTKFSANLINDEFNKSIHLNRSFIRGIIDYDRTFYNWPEKYLVKVDRASMFNSVEVRSPFMDEVLLEKTKSMALVLLFTPYAKKLFLKVKYFKVFGWRYFFAKKNGFTPPIEKLRKENFNEEDFIFIKKQIQSISSDLYTQIQTLNFDNLEKDKILFDRFFFFCEWVKKNKYIYYVQK